MSRFNTSTQGRYTTTNYEGAKAYTLSPEMELYTLTCTFALQPKFYESSNDQLDRLRGLIRNVSPLFVAKLAIYAREKMYLRTVPVVMAVELAKIHQGDSTISRLVGRIVQRADEINELLGYYTVTNNRTGTKKLGKVSNQLKKGIKEVFESGRFQEYHFGKYNRSTDVKFRDALFLTHPKPQTPEMRTLFGKIVNDTLDTPYTWETQLSEAGQASSPGTTKKAVWEELIDSGKLGYMGLLRNLRNIIQENVSQGHIDTVCGRIGDPEQVKRSKQLPFRFLSAYRMLKGMGKARGYWGQDKIIIPEGLNQSYVNQVVAALESAMTASAENLPFFKRSLFATDVSGSMMMSVSPKSVVEGYDVGTVLCMMADSRSSHSISGMYGDEWKPLDFPKKNILANANEIREREGSVGYETHFYKVLEWALDNNYSFDNIYCFTDAQLYGGDVVKLWNQYKSLHPEATLTIIDIAGYGQVSLDIRENDVYLVAGWSNDIFNVIENIKNGSDAIDTINRIEL